MRDLTVRIDGGRQVAIASYGDDRGDPVLLFHGTPGCRLGLDAFDEPARARQVRVMVPDRPGIGGSDPRPMPTVASYVDDVAALADELGLTTFGLAGFSSGGPFALACGALLPTRVSSVATIGGVAPLRDPDVRGSVSADEDRTLRLLERGETRAATRRLWLKRAVARYLPRIALRALMRGLGDADRQALADADGSAMGSVATAFAQGTDGVLNEYQVWLDPWGFDLTDVTLPVDIWHGDDDTLVGLQHAEALEAALPNATLHLLPRTGHLSILGRFGEILDRMASHRSRPPRDHRRS